MQRGNPWAPRGGDSDVSNSSKTLPRLSKVSPLGEEQNITCNPGTQS